MSTQQTKTSNGRSAAKPSCQRRKVCSRTMRRGGAIIELAIAFSLITTLTFGMVEFGYFFYVKNIFEGAAREGARAGAPWNTTVSNINTAVTNAIAPTGLSTSNPLYTVAITDTSGHPVTNLSSVASGSQYQVTLSATWGTIGNGFRPLALIGAGKVVSSTCVMQKEY